MARFKDFSPGQRLRQKITLTNVTYSVNFCKLVGVSPQLEDFVTVEFNPPGPMSAGLTCHMTVTFEPKVILMHHTNLGGAPMFSALSLSDIFAINSSQKACVDFLQDSSYCVRTPLFRTPFVLGRVLHVQINLSSGQLMY